MRKHSLTLIEVVIAFALMGFLMASLIPLYFQSQKYQRDFEKGKEQVLERQRFYFRIKHLFENSDASISKETDNLEFRYESQDDRDFPLGEKLVTSLSQRGKQIILETKANSGRPLTQVMWKDVQSVAPLKPTLSNNILTLMIDQVPFCFKKEEKK
ncbi:MAG: type II secretion system protein [Verrucomicrobia bacterium]|nr:type II secretion system protein [Verrucomicrobiota bacterium]